MDTLLLLGDSIRSFYCKNVAQELEGRMRVVWPAENCRFTLYTLRFISEWVHLVDNPEDVKVIHWNNGLWDASRHTADGLPLASGEEYGKNLERIITELRARFPKAQIIFATTTCVDPRFPYVRNEDVDEYNRIALEIMRRHDIPVDDLHAVMAAHPEYIRESDRIHETEEGARALAKQVAQCVLSVLEKD